MPTVVVLFNLKPGVSAERYEAWARSTDLPVVRRLPSVERFEVLKAQGLLSGAAEVPFRYVEILQVASIDALKADIRATPSMADVAREFREFADDPAFIVTDSL